MRTELLQMGLALCKRDPESCFDLWLSEAQKGVSSLQLGRGPSPKPAQAGALT
jgi:hypothetical protein